MSKFKSFLKQNVKPVEPVEVKLERFDEPFKLQPISLDTQEQIMAKAKVFKPNAKGKMVETYDDGKIMRLRAMHSIVYPDFHDTELQESYGVMGAEALINEMLLSDEVALLLEKISPEEVNMESKVAEAKN